MKQFTESGSGLQCSIVAYLAEQVIQKFCWYNGISKISGLKGFLLSIEKCVVQNEMTTSKSRLHSRVV